MLCSLAATRGLKTDGRCIHASPEHNEQRAEDAQYPNIDAKMRENVKAIFSTFDKENVGTIDMPSLAMLHPANLRDELSFDELVEFLIRLALKGGTLRNKEKGLESVPEQHFS